MSAPSRAHRLLPWGAAGLVSIGLLVLVVVRLVSVEAARPSVVAPIPALAPLTVERGEPACIGFTAIPARSASIRAGALAESAGVPLRATVRSAGTTLRGPARPVAANGQVDLPLPAITRSELREARVCIRAASRRPAQLLGLGEQPYVAVMRPATEANAAMLGVVLQRLTVAKAGVVSAPVVVALAVALLVSVLVAPWLVAAALRGRPLRRLAVGVLVIAGVCATAWSVVSPPFQHPDESVHLQYADVVRDTGLAPTGTLTAGRGVAVDAAAAEATVATATVSGNAEIKPPWTEPDDRRVDEGIAGAGDGPPRDVFTNATNQPPGYYLVTAAGVDRLFGDSPLDRLMVGRLLSAALFVLTIAASMRFVADVHRRRAWVAIPAGLALALYPVFSYNSAGFNPDSLFFAATACAFALTARLFRYGWTTRRGALLAVAGVVLLASKITAISLLPGFALAGGALLVRALIARRRGSDDTVTLRSLLVPVAVAAAGVAVVLGYAAASGRGILGPTGADTAGAATSGVGGVTIRGTLSFVWQSYLPRFPFQQDLIPLSGLLDVWRPALTGAFGYVDHGFGGVMQRSLGRFWGTVGVVALGALLVLAWRRRRDAWTLVEGGCYLLVAAGLLYAVGQASYLARVQGFAGFEQARYLFPILPLVAVWIASAFRIRSPVGGTIALACVTVCAFHMLAAMEIVVSRYYL